MANWKDQIDHLFGLRDRSFAEHPSSEEDAFNLLAELRRLHIGWSEFERELRVRLKRMPMLDAETQVKLARERYAIWLLD